MNSWQTLGTVSAGIAALVTAGIGLYDQFKTVYKEMTAEQVRLIKKEYGIVKDDDGWVYLRKSPNISSNAIAKLLNDSHVEIIEKKGNWFKVYTDSGREGYIFKDRLILVYEKN